jgi:hypothetical protein
MTEEAPFLPGFEPEKTIRFVKSEEFEIKDEKVSEEIRSVNDNMEENSGVQTCECPWCDIWGGGGCPEHRRKN